MIYLKVRNKRTGAVRDITQKSLSLLDKKERANYEVLSVDATEPEKKPVPQEPVVAAGVAELAGANDQGVTSRLEVLYDQRTEIKPKGKPGPKPGKGKAISAPNKGAEV